MSDDSCTYAVREETIDGATRYYAAFKDGNGLWQEVEVFREVYLALDECRRHESRQQRSERRHSEQLNLSEGQLAERIAKQPRPLEDSVALAADMQAGLATLSDTQRRRILLYHEHGLTYEQIAKAEKRSVATIAESIKAAEEKLKLFWEEP